MSRPEWSSTWSRRTIDWSDQAKAEVRAMRESGMGTTAIGRRFNTTKNAIVGLLRRMHMPPCPNPVGRPSDWKPEEDAQIRALAGTMSDREIGARIGGRGKRAVNARRLKLGIPACDAKLWAQRTNAKRAKAARAKAAAAAPKKPAPKAKVLRPNFLADKPAPSRPFPALPPLRSALQPEPGGALSCQWIEGDPRVPGWHFCPEPRAAFGPYCDCHRAICFLSAKGPAAAEAA